MEFQVKVGHLKTNAKGNVEVTRKEFREYLNSFCEDTMMVTLLSTIAWLMEDEEFKGSPERFDDLFYNAQRIIQTVYDPDSGFEKNDLARVVKQGTGIEVMFKK